MTTQIKSNLFYAIFGLAVGAYLMLAFGPKPEPKIEYKEKIVEVEKKSTVKKKTETLLPDGTIKITEDEITDYLKNYSSDKNLEVTPSYPRHQILPIYTLKGSWGGQYLHNFTSNIVGGVGYKDGAFLTFGVQF